MAGSGGRHGTGAGTEVDSPLSDREGKQPISLLTAMLQQHQKVLEDRMRDRERGRGRENILEGEEEEERDEHASVDVGEVTCGAALGLGLSNMTATVSRPSPQPIIVQSNGPRPILLPPAPPACMTSTAPTTRASSVASAAPATITTAVTFHQGHNLSTAIKPHHADPATTADVDTPVTVNRKSSLTFAVNPHGNGNNAKAGPGPAGGGRRGSLEAADRAMIKRGMIVEEEDEERGVDVMREEEEGKVGGSDEEEDEEAVEDEEEEADDAESTNEEEGNATDRTDQGDEQDEEEDEEEDDYPVKHGSHRPSLTFEAGQAHEAEGEAIQASGDEDQGFEEDESAGEEDHAGNASGYEEDSEAGSSSDEAVARIGSVIARFTTAMRRSPQLKHRFMNRARVEDEDDEVKETHIGNLPGHLSFAETRPTSGSRHQQEDRPRFPFARPTNYRRRRADTVEDLIHGSATSLIAPTSFVRIDTDRSPEHVKGKGHINFKATEMPTGVRRGRSPGGSESCTRHRSPPPSQARQAFKIRGKAASDICPPAGMSPSAGKMQMRRGVSDPPSKRKGRETGPNQVFALKSAKMGVPRSEEDAALSSPLSKGKATLTPVPSDVGETSAAGGWRSDDALFAVPTVQRKASIPDHPAQTSIIAPKPRFARPPTPLSPMRSDKSRSNPSSRPLSPYESDYPGQSGNKSASEKIVGGVLSVSRRVSETIAHPFGKAEALPPSEPLLSASIPEKTVGLGPIQPSKTCRVAVDTTPAIAGSMTTSQPEAPIQRVLHDKLAGSASRALTSPEYPEQLVTPLKSGYQSGPGERDLFSATSNNNIGNCSIQAQRGALTDNESNISMTRHKRSKPIVCPLPKATTTAH